MERGKRSEGGEWVGRGRRGFFGVRVCVVVVEVGGSGWVCGRGGGREGRRRGIALAPLAVGCFPLVVVVVGGALVRNTLFGKQRICMYDISKRFSFVHRHRLCAFWWLPFVSGSPWFPSVVVVALASLRWWLVWLSLPLFGSGWSGCHCPFGGGGGCLCLRWELSLLLELWKLPPPSVELPSLG